MSTLILSSFSTLTLFSLVLLSALAIATSADGQWTSDTLMEMIADIKGTDTRLVRWDAGEHTFEKQSDGACDFLSEVAIKVIVEGGREMMNGDGGDDEQRLQRLACEYATLCITDNPQGRAKFSDVPGIHQAVVDLARSSKAKTSAMACHVIYIASFNNKKNQQGFFNSKAIYALARIILDDLSLPIQSMWAMAALQNLAASYCSTGQDGRCDWMYPPNDNNLVVSQSSLPVVSDGAPIRQEALKIPDLVEALIEYACEGPVEGSAEEGNILPGENAEAGRDEENPAIIAWAAAGALKNLAIEMEGRKLIEDNKDALRCFCELKYSDDWLEEDKGEAVLLHLRPSNPCWRDNDGELSCVDGFFVDAEEGYTCTDYRRDVTYRECNEDTDTFTGKPATNHCCNCGGGIRFDDYDYDYAKYEL